MRRDPKPADAWWDPADSEWVHGDKDAAGRLVGEVRYWNADGVLISTAEHVAGKPHGIARRYYANGEIAQDSTYVDGVIDGKRTFHRPRDPAITADGYLARCSSEIATYHCIYEDGDLIGMQYFDRDGNELTEHGRPMKPRPPGIPPTAFHLEGQGWYWMRRSGEAGAEQLEAREYYDSGALRFEIDRRTGNERRYHANGAVWHEGRRTTEGNRHTPIGVWSYFDADGVLRKRVELEAGLEVHRSWHFDDGVVHEGPVQSFHEVGTWVIRGAHGAVLEEVDLGSPASEADLLAHAVAADELDDSYRPDARDRSAVATLARARRTGISGDRSQLGHVVPGTGWRPLQAGGSPASAPHYFNDKLVGLLASLRWSSPDAALLAALAAALFRANRAAAALDVLEAAFVVAEAMGTAIDPAWQRARVIYLRVVGRVAEAERLEVRPVRLDERGLALLAEIRDAPDDDACRLVFADHIASRFPEHAALIVAQCQGRHALKLRRAFVDTLPGWLQDYPDELVRGFFGLVRHVDAQHFVETDPDLLYRVAPTSTTLELDYATDHIATIVTLPALRRYRELAFSETWMDLRHAEQVASCPHLEQLEHLGLVGNTLGDPELAVIVGSSAYPRLHSLDLDSIRDDRRFTIRGLEALPRAPFAASLQVLALTNRRLGDGVVDLVAALPALVDVDLAGNRLTDRAATVLAGLPHSFTSLQLANNELSESARRLLAERFGEVVHL